MESLSWKRYDNQHNLSDLLTVAARSCVDARAEHPAEYLAAYFTKNCSGDRISSIATHTHYCPCGGPSLRVTLRLLNGMEAGGTALAVPPLRPADGPDAADPAPGDSAADPPGDPAAAAGLVVRRHYAPALLAVGAGDQRGFDAALARPYCAEEPNGVGRAVAFALSAAAALAAARCAAIAPFRHVRHLAGLSAAPSAGSVTAAGDLFAMPQLCMAFFGPDTPSAARVALRDVCVIPSMPRGALRRGVLEKLFAAFRHFARAHNAQPRADGALSFDAFDGIAEAIALAEESLRAVGLRPVEDICLGVRLAAVATAQRDGDVTYALFPGDADVSGAQLAEYVREQLQPRSEFVVFVEDTHCGKDVAGGRRVLAHLGADMTVSGRDPCGSSGDGPAGPMGLRDAWTPNVVAQPCALGTMSEIMDFARHVRAHDGRTVSFATDTFECNAAAVAHIAVGLGARFLCMGGLLNQTQCDVLTHVMCIQDELEQTRTLRQEAPKIIHGELPEVPTDVVPEIKRKLEKKKRKK